MGNKLDADILLSKGCGIFYKIPWASRHLGMQGELYNATLASIAADEELHERLLCLPR